MKEKVIKLDAEKFAALRQIHTEKSDRNAIEQVIDIYLLVRRDVLSTVKLKFTKEELTALVNNFNGTMFQVQFSSPSVLIASIEDGERYESVCTRHNVKVQDIVEKIATLSHTESLFLIEEFRRFCESGEEDLNSWLC